MILRLHYHKTPKSSLSKNGRRIHLLPQLSDTASFSHFAPSTTRNPSLTHHFPLNFKLSPTQWPILLPDTNDNHLQITFFLNLTKLPPFHNHPYPSHNFQPLPSFTLLPFQKLIAMNWKTRPPSTFHLLWSLLHHLTYLYLP